MNAVLYQTPDGFDFLNLDWVESINFDAQVHPYTSEMPATTVGKISHAHIAFRAMGPEFSPMDETHIFGESAKSLYAALKGRLGSG